MVAWQNGKLVINHAIREWDGERIVPVLIPALGGGRAWRIECHHCLDKPALSMRILREIENDPTTTVVYVAQNGQASEGSVIFRHVDEETLPQIGSVLNCVLQGIGEAPSSFMLDHPSAPVKH